MARLDQKDRLLASATRRGVATSGLFKQQIQRAGIEELRSLPQALATSRATIAQQKQARESQFTGRVAKNRFDVAGQVARANQIPRGGVIAEGDRSNSIFFTPETGGFEAIGASGQRLSSAGIARDAVFDVGSSVSQAIQERQKSGVFGETVNLVVPSQAAANDPRIQKILRESPGKVNLIIRPGGAITKGGRGGGGGITGFFAAARQAAGIVRRQEVIKAPKGTVSINERAKFIERGVQQINQLARLNPSAETLQDQRALGVALAAGRANQFFLERSSSTGRT